MKIQRAVAVDFALLRYPVAASVKIDGVRAYVSDDGVVMTRQNKPVPSQQVQAMFGKLKYAGLDGELYVGNANDADVFSKTTSAVMSRDKPHKQLFFAVFDTTAVRPLVPYSQRLEDAFVRVKKLGNPRIKFIPHRYFHNLAALLAFEADTLAKGYEGIIIRYIHATYKEGKSTPHHQGYLRLKRFVEGEAEIIGYNEQLTNENEKVCGKRTSHKAGRKPTGVLGSWIVRDLETDKVFNVGTGISARQRKDWWKVRGRMLGLIIRHRTFPKGVVDLPRFPAFAGFRDRADL